MRRNPTWWNDEPTRPGWPERDPFAWDPREEWFDMGDGWSATDDPFAGPPRAGGSARLRHEPTGPADVVDLKDLAPPPRLAPDELPPPPATRPVWIRIELVDPAGRPLPNHPYRLRLADGSVRKGVFDDSGELRFDDVTPGLCTLVLPTEDELEWAPPAEE